MSPIDSSSFILLDQFGGIGDRGRILEVRDRDARREGGGCRCGTLEHKEGGQDREKRPWRKRSAGRIRKDRHDSALFSFEQFCTQLQKPWESARMPPPSAIPRMPGAANDDARHYRNGLLRLAMMISSKRPVPPAGARASQGFW